MQYSCNLRGITPWPLFIFKPKSNSIQVLNGKLNQLDVSHLLFRNTFFGGGIGLHYRLSTPYLTITLPEKIAMLDLGMYRT